MTNNTITSSTHPLNPPDQYSQHPWSIHSFNAGAQQLERALAELAQDNQKQEERIHRETKRNQKSEERKEKSLLKALNRLHVWIESFVLLIIYVIESTH